MKFSPLGAAAVAMALVLAAPAASAHHSVYGIFDVTRLIEVKGRFTGADIINPHGWFNFEELDENGEVKLDESGSPIVWSFETPGPAGLRRMGITQNLFTIGGDYTIFAPPALDGSSKGLFLLTIFPDGRKLFIGNPMDPIFADFADELRAAAEQ